MLHIHVRSCRVMFIGRCTIQCQVLGSFNNFLNNHYLILRQFFHWLKYCYIAFFLTKRERESMLFSQPNNQITKNDIVKFLTNRPFDVQSSCIANMKRSKKVPADSISVVDSKDGVYRVKSSTRSSVYDVNITSNCSCPYFFQHNIPCKHMFSIFAHTEWSWNNLPYRKPSYMVLEAKL